MTDSRFRFHVHLFADHPEHAAVIHFLRHGAGADADARSQARELKNLIRLGFSQSGFALAPVTRIPSVFTPTPVTDQSFLVSFRSEKDADIGGWLKHKPGSFAYRPASAVSALARDLAVAGFRIRCGQDLRIAMAYGYTAALPMPTGMAPMPFPTPVAPPPPAATKERKPRAKPTLKASTTKPEAPRQAAVVSPVAPPKLAPVTAPAASTPAASTTPTPSSGGDEFDLMSFL